MTSDEQTARLHHIDSYAECPNCGGDLAIIYRITRDTTGGIFHGDDARVTECLRCLAVWS